jgi:hypothetical protein
MRLRAILGSTEPERIPLQMDDPSPRKLSFPGDRESGGVTLPVRSRHSWRVPEACWRRSRRSVKCCAIGGLPLAALESSLDVDEADLRSQKTHSAGRQSGVVARPSITHPTRSCDRCTCSQSHFGRRLRPLAVTDLLNGLGIRSERDLSGAIRGRL